MRKKIFFVLVGIMLLVACSSQNKSKNNAASAVSMEQSQEDVDSLSVEAIDDSGEALAEDTVSASVIDTISETNTDMDQE
jgi:uncharacterized protein YcfL